METIHLVTDICRKDDQAGWFHWSFHWMVSLEFFSSVRTCTLAWPTMLQLHLYQCHREYERTKSIWDNNIWIHVIGFHSEAKLTSIILLWPFSQSTSYIRFPPIMRRHGFRAFSLLSVYSEHFSAKGFKYSLLHVLAAWYISYTVVPLLYNLLF